MVNFEASALIRNLYGIHMYGVFYLIIGSENEKSEKKELGIGFLQRMIGLRKQSFKWYTEWSELL